MIKNAGARKVVEYTGAMEHDFTIAGIANMVKKGIEEGLLCHGAAPWAVIQFIVKETGWGITTTATKKAMVEAGSCAGYAGYHDRWSGLAYIDDVYDVASRVSADEFPDDTHSLAAVGVVARHGYACVRPTELMALLGFEPAGRVKIGDMSAERFVRVRTPTEALELIEQCGGHWPRRRK
jgi:hypothetical protein